jgi:hypothetical protein
MNRFVSVLFAFVLAVCVASPVFADDAASSSSAVASSFPASSSSAPAVEFDGADSVVGGVNKTIDSAYDNMPVQDSGVLGFMAGVTAAIPVEFVSAIVLSLVLCIVLLLLKFLWT